jgi:hypothetical protein
MYHSDIRCIYFDQRRFEIAQFDILGNMVMLGMKIFQLDMSGTKLIQGWKNIHN